MALLQHQLQSVLLAGAGGGAAHVKKAGRAKRLCCPAIAIDAPASSDAEEVAAVRWGSTKLQGRRSEMEDDFVIRTDGLDSFSFAAVLDGHAGFSSVQFLKDELYKACATALQEGLLLSRRDFSAIQSAILGAFADVDAKLLHWLEMENEDESGSTATAMFLGNDILIVSHVGDSCVVLSHSGKAEVLTSSHRPYGNNKASLSEIRRIREAGGWIANGRICGDISVSRAFGDIRFKTKKNEMLKKGVAEGKWTEKFISRVNFTGDLVTSTPDVFQVALGPDVEFLLLASDGLSDYMNSSDAVEFVRNQLSEHGNVQRACEALAETALDRGSEDNVTIVIADLGRTDWKNITTQDANIFLEISQALVTVAVVSVGIWISSFLIS